MNQTEHEREAPPNVAIERNRATFRGNRPMKRPMGASRARRTRARGHGDNGAALVEFALIMPFLFLLIFAIIEFGWGWSQSLEVRHGSREGARLAGVNYRTDPSQAGSDQTEAIVTAICQRMDLPNTATVTLTLAGGTTERAQGDLASVEVAAELDQLTGFLGFALDGISLDQTVDFRLDRDVSWNAGSGTCA